MEQHACLKGLIWAASKCIKGFWWAASKCGVEFLHCRNLVRLHPKVKDIVFVATIKVLLKPMVEAIPGFGEYYRSQPFTVFSVVFGG
jgi:hypothetical protein